MARADINLSALLAAINRRFFSNRIVTSIKWEIPPGFIEEPVNEDTTYSRVSAAAYLPDIPCVVIHPALRAKKVPLYVLRYLIHHECLHQLFPPTDGVVHPPCFMEKEFQLPHRDKAISWLTANKFPVMNQKRIDEAL